ncbi:MAG TPA: VWA domain-containing protein, partial [Spirochaetota bacterium]|nr:VWA domain-containing protein [Spirochaetota bacterium]
MLKKILIVFFVFSLFFASFLNAQSSDEALIQMAILLDTSNSMDGLIDQAKSQLWKIVNELALSKKNGKSPRLEVALYQYGNSGLSDYDGYIEMVSPLTTDLDLISDKLFNLKTYGGDEYCGYVIKKATSDLKWNKSQGILKLIFIAGNEPFNQGKVDYRKSCKESISKGIIVNTIHCGDFQVGIDTFWKKGADIADGKYVCIDQSIRDVYVEAPQDKEIESLNKKLNDTYVYYGKGGAEKKELQVKQDSNAL